MGVVGTLHPERLVSSASWLKWRLAYSGGTDFIDTYLKQLSSREDPTEFADRKAVTYCPAFAKAAINDIKNAIFQRLVDISRAGGSENYHAAAAGSNGGVDYRGSSMNSFIGRHVLPELLVLGKVGIYVDMDTDPGPTISAAAGKHPYLYLYTRESIMSWDYDTRGRLISVLLEDSSYAYDDEILLPSGMVRGYRLLTLEDSGVKVKFYDTNGKDLNKDVILQLDRIPFVIVELPASLMQDVADYQVALLNIESIDVSYLRKSNSPFYVEQFDTRSEMPMQVPPGFNPETDTQPQRSVEISVGTSQGRRYGKGLERPSFIHPSAEPIKASMEKGEHIKQDIRKLVNLTVANLSEDPNLENGLSFIGLVLEQCEREIAYIWAKYEGNKSPAEVTYPETYDIKNDSERIEEATKLEDLLDKLPSDTYKRELGKRVAQILLRGRVAAETLNVIFKEIDNAPTMTSDPKVIAEDWKNGFVSTATASRARGYEDGEVEKAAKDRAERIALAQTAQGGQGGQARGDLDTQKIMSGNQDPANAQPTSSEEKLGKPKRGEAKL